MIIQEHVAEWYRKKRPLFNFFKVKIPRNEDRENCETVLHQLKLQLKL